MIDLVVLVLFKFTYPEVFQYAAFLSDDYLGGRSLPVVALLTVVVIPVYYGPHLYPYPKTSALIPNPNPNRGLQPRLFLRDLREKDGGGIK